MADPEEHDEQGVRRLVGFTDGVVAIAITLIVLPLVDAARDLGTKPAIDFLSDNGFNLLAAGLSFVVIALFWMDHHRLYRRVSGATAPLIRANLVWLAAIVFLPLPTVLIVDSPGHDPIAEGLYIGTVLVAQVAIRAQELIIVRERLVPSAAEVPAGLLWRDWIVVGLVAAALIVTLSVPAAGLYPLLLAVLARPLGRLARRNQPAVADAERLL